MSRNGHIVTKNSRPACIPRMAGKTYSKAPPASGTLLATKGRSSRSVAAVSVMCEILSRHVRIYNNEQTATEFRTRAGSHRYNMEP